jgi:hypothetical protein
LPGHPSPVKLMADTDGATDSPASTPKSEGFYRQTSSVHSQANEPPSRYSHTQLLDSLLQGWIPCCRSIFPGSVDWIVMHAQEVPLAKGKHSYILGPQQR